MFREVPKMRAGLLNTMKSEYGIEEFLARPDTLLWYCVTVASYLWN